MLAPGPQTVWKVASYPVVQSEDVMLPERIQSKIMPEPNSGCWLWTGYVAPNGYGKMQVKLPGGGWTTKYAHREIYKAVKGEIPPGLDIDHRCRQRCCVNPDHLRPATRKENVANAVRNRAKLLARTHCKRGHEFDADNTRWFKSPWSGLPVRQCRTCLRVAMKRHDEKRRGARRASQPV